MINEISAQSVDASFWNRVSSGWSNPDQHFLPQNERVNGNPDYRCVKSGLSPLVERMLASEDLILDLGSGGLPTIYLPQELMPRLTAVDIAADMLRNNPAATRIVHDVNAPLPFEDNSFGFLTSFFLLRYLEDPGIALSEMSRVLKVGGEFTAVDYTKLGHTKEVFTPNMAQLNSMVLAAGFRDVQVTALTERYVASLYSEGLELKTMYMIAAKK